MNKGSAALREKILLQCFEPYEGNFATGAAANNKLDLEQLVVGSATYNAIVRGIGKTAIRYEPDFCVGVPDGATGLAMHVAHRMGIDWYPLQKSDEKPKEIIF